jgi:hypothetical protein
MEPELEMLQKRNRRLTRERVRWRTLSLDEERMIITCSNTSRKTDHKATQARQRIQMPAAFRD